MPLADLIETNDIQIGEPLSIPFGYNERFYIERTLNNRLNPYIPENLKDLLENHRIICISDTAGMGKSIVLAHLSKKIKELDKTRWVININLIDYINELKQPNESIDAVDFLTQKLLKLTSPLSYAIFRQRLHDKRMVLMLDGFDEIGSLCEKYVIRLVQDLRQTTLEQIWLTSRPYVQQKLEDQLQVQCYTLQPFTEENKIEFLSKYWETTLQVKDEHGLMKFAKKLLDVFAMSIGDDDFTGIPLQSRMLGESFDEECKIYCDSNGDDLNLPLQLDIVALYEKFLRRKYVIYLSERDNPCEIKPKTGSIVTVLSDTLHRAHQTLAIQMLFPKSKYSIIQNKDKIFIEEGNLNNVGIVQKNIQQMCDEQIESSHQNIAQFRRYSNFPPL